MPRTLVQEPTTEPYPKPTQSTLSHSILRLKGKVFLLLIYYALRHDKDSESGSINPLLLTSSLNVIVQFLVNFKTILLSIILSIIIFGL
jgi:hypothetical protein